MVARWRERATNNLSRYTSIGLDGHGVIRTNPNSCLLKTLGADTRGIERCPIGIVRTGNIKSQ